MSRRVKNRRVRQLLTLLIAGLFLCGCNKNPSPDDEITTLDYALVGTVEELVAFFEDGPQKAQLTNNIDIKKEMLSLKSERGAVYIDGRNYTIKGAGSALIRLYEGGELHLSNITLDAQQIAIGLLADAKLGGENCTIKSQNAAIYAAKTLTIAKSSALSLYSSGGMGITCAGLILEQNASLSIEAQTVGVDADKEDITLNSNSSLVTTAKGDNIIHTNGTLTLGEGSILRSINSGDHNAALVGSLAAQPSATLELTGGLNGIGLFVVEQYEDVTVLGFCLPDVRISNGDGSVTFLEEE
ncbi:hypothetical protein LJC42_05025 [Eubacteriales bacterium OttesenSCG-928-K08]|nr:hypothetical protein [Eubacteriales bacterium OttesenSCG-928-K08]